MALVKEKYALTSGWPNAETFGLTSQVRRAAVSIPANLAEGRGRGTQAEMARFAQIAMRSAYELDTVLEIADELNLSDAPEINQLRVRLSNLAPQISSYIRAKRR
jgi:four helix bundle protein